ncbi:MAG: hypothetical protein HY011_18995 [Acidobacteria bacterium]|nr:hypothetical protein [Acidobacteriota bacterium]
MMAPYECKRLLPDGTLEQAWFYEYEAVLFWIHQRLDLDAAVSYNGILVNRAQLVEAVEHFIPDLACLDKRDALNLLDSE